MEHWTLEYVKGHLVVSRGQGRYLLDTGSPVSFLFGEADSDTEWLGIANPSAPSALPLLDIAEHSVRTSIEDHVDENIAGLVGMDVLGRFDVLVSIADSAVRLRPEEIAPIGSTRLEVKSLLGCPLVGGLAINGSDKAMIWDTGAHLSYVANETDIAGLRTIDQITDFHPFSTPGTFTVEVVNGVLSMAGRERGIHLRMASWPDSVPKMGFDILGSELCEHFDAHLSMRQGFLSLRRRYLYSKPTTIRTSLALPQVQHMMGKRIADVVWRKNGTSKPRHQFFLIFDDGTHYEIYADEHLKPGGGIDSGGTERVLEYVHKFEEHQIASAAEGLAADGEPPGVSMADVRATIDVTGSEVGV